MADEKPAHLAALEEDSAQLEESLNHRQRAFVREYLIDLNASQAAIRAGYSAATAGQIGAELLKHPKIAPAIERGKASRAARVGVTQEQVLAEMSVLANACVENYVIADDGTVKPAPGAPEGVMGAIQSVKRKLKIFKNREGEETGREYDVELRLWDKPGSLKLMGRHVGLFPNTVELTGAGGGPIQVANLTNEELAAEAAKLAAQAAALAKEGDGV